MSAKKSWDIQPKARAKQAAEAEPAARRPAVRAVVRTPAAPKQARSTRTDRLRDRRRKQRNAIGYALVGIFIVLGFSGTYVLRLPALRIQNIISEGIHEKDVRAVAQVSLFGSYVYIIPKDSIFFFPSTKIRISVLDAFPDIEAVSITRSSFNSISIIPSVRTSAFIWCGATYDASFPAQTCYRTDSNGLIFSAIDSADGILNEPSSATVATSTPMHEESIPSTTLARLSSSSAAKVSPTTYGDMRIYGNLETNASSTDPIRSHVIGSEHIPAAILFTKALGNLGARVLSLVIRGDEADAYIAGGSRLTYVLGHETDATALAVAVLPKINITDGSISYVDLRFLGKAYIMRRNGQVTTQ